VAKTPTSFVNGSVDLVDPAVRSEGPRSDKKPPEEAQKAPKRRLNSFPPSDPLSVVNSNGPAASNRAERLREAEEDSELVRKAQQGDEVAFRKLVERHQRRAFAIAIGLVRDENDAREIVQEAFLRVYRSLERFKGGSSFFTWLYRIVTNLAIDLMRKPARREAELFDNPSVADDADAFSFVSRIDGADPLDMVRRQEIATRIHEALEDLPAYHRSVILMREIEGMSYQQMADAMQVSKGTIMSRLFHARQKLQRALADCYREQQGREPAGRGSTK
jgi:RNA polymerase sigma-70 factor, ECF subfamily